MLYSFLHTKTIQVASALLALMLFFPTQVKAEGSRDLYPNGTIGYRAQLVSSTSVNALSWPFPNLGTHYVYAKVGETICLASNWQQGQTGTSGSSIRRLRLFNPVGTEVSLTIPSGRIGNNSSPYYGQIANRAAEIAGPALTEASRTGDQYVPIYYTVPTGGEGVYRVEFRAAETTGNPTDTRLADTNWSTSSNSAGIAAWDISVINSGKTAFLSGRVYTNVLNLSNGNTNVNREDVFFNGKVFAVTKDGYTYRVDNNGSNGIWFTFFVNNNGFFDATTKLPIYKSLNTSSGISNQVHNPNNADANGQITHKMFYNLPNSDLPPKSPIASTSNAGTTWQADSTWLKRLPIKPDVTAVRVEGIDGSTDHISIKGGYICFNADLEGNYRVVIESPDPIAHPFTKLELHGASVVGENKIYWDGKDGAGIPLPQGFSPSKISVKLQAAEVHFPFFDMEYNKNGIKIELLNHELFPAQVKIHDMVFWNDSAINISNLVGAAASPIVNSHLYGSTGISSSINGHKWGAGGTGSARLWGDEKSIDTWSFVDGEETTIEGEIEVRVADLEVSSFTQDKNILYVGDEVTFNISVRNNGPNHVTESTFGLYLPVGYDVSEFTPVFSGNYCGGETVSISYDPIKRLYHSKLALPIDCEVSYTIKARVTDDAIPGTQQFFATMLRSGDYSDPDATNQSNSANPIAPPDAEDPFDCSKWYVPPIDPFFECAQNGLGGNCNNIRELNPTVVRETDLAIVKKVSNREALVGELVSFSLAISNSGIHEDVNVVVTDSVPTGYIVQTVNNGGVLTGTTITWEIPSLAAGASDTLSFTAIVTAIPNHVNTATITGDGEDGDLSNNSSSDGIGRNLWMGGTDTDWNKDENWTANKVPLPGEDIEFATVDNYGTAAERDLYLDQDRVVGDIINGSDKNLVVTTGNELEVEGEVIDDNPLAGTIVVQADPNKPSGSLYFKDPSKNGNVKATVEFYNQAYHCDDCGFYQNQWQYFGIPVKGSSFPYLSPQVETVNQWVEPHAGNKWQQAPYAPDTELKAFKGYEINNSSTTQPTHIYAFEGELVVGAVVLPLSLSSGVHYSGVHILANSYTAAIPIQEDAIAFSGTWDQTVYLFNTGTRDQWRKLNGGTLTHNTRSGQYRAVPLNLAGMAGLDDKIPSMHSFLVRAESLGNLTLDYDKLVKNGVVNGKVWRTAQSGSTSELPHVVVDFISDQSADRVWLFEHPSTTSGFDAGWDAVKQTEAGMAQAYAASRNHAYQVATTSSLSGNVLAWTGDASSRYQIHLKVSADVENRNLQLLDRQTGLYYPISNGAEYQVSGGVSTLERFEIVDYAPDKISLQQEKAVKTWTENGVIKLVNTSNDGYLVQVFDSTGKPIVSSSLPAGGVQELNADRSWSKGLYIVKITGKQNLYSSSRLLVQ